MRIVTYQNINELVNSSLLNKASIIESDFAYGFKTFNPMPVAHVFPKSKKAETSVQINRHISKTPNIR